jgi:hypothetical protein
MGLLSDSQRVTIRGTHQGELDGIPATGREIEVAAMSLLRIEGGRSPRSGRAPTGWECWSRSAPSRSRRRRSAGRFKAEGRGRQSPGPALSDDYEMELRQATPSPANSASVAISMIGETSQSK